MDIERVVELTRGPEMDFLTPWNSYQVLMTASMRRWEVMSLDAFEVVQNHLKNIIKIACERKFGCFKTNGLESDVRCVIVAIFKLMIKEQRLSLS